MPPASTESRQHDEVRMYDRAEKRLSSE